MRLNDGRVVPNFVGQALRGEPLTVYGDGSQTRSFCYVSDLVEGIVRLLHSEDGGPINVGNPSEITILAFAQVINRLTGNQGASCTSPCRPTIHTCGNPISPAPGRSWAGNRRLTWRRDWRVRLTISGPRCTCREFCN